MQQLYVRGHVWEVMPPYIHTDAVGYLLVYFIDNSHSLVERCLFIIIPVLTIEFEEGGSIGFCQFCFDNNYFKQIADAIQTGY